MPPSIKIAPIMDSIVSDNILLIALELLVLILFPIMMYFSNFNLRLDSKRFFLLTICDLYILNEPSLKLLYFSNSHSVTIRFSIASPRNSKRS